MQIRPTTRADIAALQNVLDATGLFPRDLLPDMVSGFLSGAKSLDLWLTCEVGGTAVGFCYAVPEALADRVWNMLAIAVLPSEQHNGVGTALARHLETRLAEAGQRILIADTSGTDAFAQTRAFYRRNGYREEARIRQFWAEGDDKVTFLKPLVQG